MRLCLSEPDGSLPLALSHLRLAKDLKWDSVCKLLNVVLQNGLPPICDPPSSCHRWCFHLQPYPQFRGARSWVIECAQRSAGRVASTWAMPAPSSVGLLGDLEEGCGRKALGPALQHAGAGLPGVSPC